MKASDKLQEQAVQQALDTMKEMEKGANTISKLMKQTTGIMGQLLNDCPDDKKDDVARIIGQANKLIQNCQNMSKEEIDAEIEKIKTWQTSL